MILPKVVFKGNRPATRSPPSRPWQGAQDCTMESLSAGQATSTLFIDYT